MKRKKLQLSLALLIFSMGITHSTSAQSHQNVKLVAKENVKAVTVLEEDFSKWSAGTEEVPDNNAVSGKHLKYKIPENLTKMKGWTGDDAYQAGGTCCLKLSSTGYRAGFISTPEMELYGDVVLTFRAKRLSEAHKNGRLWVALCDNSSGPVDEITVNLTTEWQDFKMVSNKGTFAANNVFQFQAEECNMLIDDIKIVRTRNRIPAPVALAPINKSSSSFIAKWNPTKEAKSYLLNVFYKGMPENVIPETKVVEGFDAINLKDDKATINTTNPNYPEGWTIDVSSKGDKDVYTSAKDLNSGSLSICFDEVGDYIITPKTPAPITNLSFWVKPSSMEKEPNYKYSMVGVSIFSNGKWTPVANIPNNWMKKDGGFYTLDMVALGENTTQVKIELTQKNLLSFAIDDVTYTYKSLPIEKLLVADKEVTDTFCLVSDINPEIEYFYYVRAKDGEVISDRSNNMWVDGIVGITPTVNEATKVTSTSYTANWNRIHNAETYQLNNYKVVKATKDMENVVVLHEDFNNIKVGTVNSPVTAYDRTTSLAKKGYTKTDWMQQLSALADGMAGAQKVPEYLDRMGLVVSPRLSLDCDGGAFEVDLKAYNSYPGDSLYVLIMKDVNDRIALEGKKIALNKEAGMTSATVKFEGNVADWNTRRNIRIAFMSIYGQQFYIDEVTIRQNLKTGETLYCPYQTIFTEDNSYAVKNLEAGFDYAYDVVAMAKKNTTEYVSEYSAMMPVKNTPTGINTVENTNARIVAENGRIDVYTSGNANISIYDVQGRLIAKADARQEGRFSFPVQSAIYIVKVNDELSKIFVK